MPINIEGQVVHTQMGGDEVDGERKTDGAGYGFDVQITMPYPNTNNPPVDIRVIPPNGPFPDQPTYTWMCQYKPVAVGLDHTGPTLIVWAKTHQTNVQGARIIATEYAYIPNAWHVTAADILEEGGAGAYLPDGGGGGEVGITKQDVVDAIRETIGIGDGRTLGDDWGAHHQPAPHQSSYDWRQVLEDKVKSAVSESGVVTTANIRDAIYQAVLDDIWLNLEKMVQGTDNPTGMNAQQLHDGLVALVHNAKA